jgi:hypothetical protein
LGKGTDAEALQGWRNTRTALLASCGLSPTLVGRGDKPRDYKGKVERQWYCFRS